MNHVVVELKRLREEKGITLRALAPKLGIAFSSLNAYETGRADPPLSRVLDLAHELGASVVVDAERPYSYAQAALVLEIKVSAASMTDQQCETLLAMVRGLSRNR
jgi:transcriptional regulator with XRE-family HTH domain